MAPGTQTRPAAGGRNVVRSAAGRTVSYAAAALVAVCFLFSFHGLWGRDLRLPIDAPLGDYLLTASVVRGVMQHGWYTTNPALGAPFGLDFQDYPMSEGLHFLFFQIAGWLGLDVVLAINLYYILGYILIAVTSLYVFRRLGLPTLPGIAAGLLFAFLPHHYIRGEYHLLLSAYYMIPPVVLVLLWVASGEPLIAGAAAGGRLPRLTRKGWQALAVCVLAGSAGIYYALFAGLFLVVAAIYSALRDRALRRLIGPALALAVLGATLAANVAPTLLYQHRHGRNPAVAQRSFVEADIYGMKIAQLLLPIQDHRIAFLAHVKSIYNASVAPYVPNNDQTVPQGAVASAGFLVLIGWTLWGGVIRRGGETLSPVSTLNLTAVLAATIGGFGSLFSFVISPEIRAYHRISVYIAFFSLIAVLIAVRAAGERWFRPGARRHAFSAVAALAMLAGLWDLTPRALAAGGGMDAAFLSDRQFTRDIERRVPPGSMIYQLPYFPFPENGPVERMRDYDHLRGYLHSRQLRWSYGAMKGRAADAWERAVAAEPAAQMLATVAGAGFKGIYIDRFGYPDRAAALMASLSQLLRQQPLESPDGRMVFFATAPGSGVAARAPVPVTVTVRNCGGLEHSETSEWYWCPSDAVLEFTNPGSQPGRIGLSLTLKSGEAAESNLRMEGLLTRKMRVNAAGHRVSEDLVIPPGTQVLRIHSDAHRLVAPGDPRTLVFAIMDLRVRPESP